ncbi:serine/threonine-protein kinase [Actinomycetes bacterium KLBMP 9759]
MEGLGRSLHAVGSGEVGEVLYRFAADGSGGPSTPSRSSTGQYSGVCPAIANWSAYGTGLLAGRPGDGAISALAGEPHVIPIHDFGDVDGRLYIDMRLVDGGGLDQLIAAGPLDPRRAVALIGQVAEALNAAHDNGVVDRDIKPSNILVTRSDFVYLIDFGIARALDDDLTAVTQDGATVGTLAYMACERSTAGRSMPARGSTR